MLRRWRKLLIVLCALDIGLNALWFSQPRDLYSRYERIALANMDRQSRSPSRFMNWLRQHLPYRGGGVNLSDWERDFGKDPRYWQMRKQLGRNGEINDFIAAIDRGVYDAASFELIPTSYVEEAGGEKKVLDYFDKAIACDPDNAWFYYRKSGYLLNLGEIETARELLRQGNTAKNFYTPIPFPASEAYKRVGKVRTRKQKAIVGYIIREAPMPNYIKMKDEYRNACVAFALGYPLEFGDELLTRARRMGQSRDEQHLPHLVAAVLANVVLSYADEELIEFSPEQYSELERIKSELEGAKTVAEESSVEAVQKLGRYVEPGSATGYSNKRPPTRADYVRAYENYVIDTKYFDRYSACFDCLDPPPLALWAAGRLQADGRMSKEAQAGAESDSR